MFEIKKNVPILKDPTQKYPFKDMEVWDMFEAPLLIRGRLSSYLIAFKKNNPEKLFLTRKINENTVWIWRTK